MTWGWLSDDMISISRRMCIRSCSSLILSFWINLMATWEQRMQESEEKGLAGKGVPEDTLGALTLVICLQPLQRPQRAPREASPPFTGAGGREAGGYLSCYICFITHTKITQKSYGKNASLFGLGK